MSNLRFSLPLVALAAASVANAQTPVLSYELNGSYAPAIGTGADLTPSGGTLGASSYAFGPNQGLTLPSSSLPSLSNYTIQFQFQFDQTDGYRRILDFKDATSDNGFYILNGGLNFYPDRTSFGTFAANTSTDVVLVRDGAAQELRGYIDGARVFTLGDTAGYGIFSGTSARFFLDDNAVANEVSGGSVDAIRFYDGALSDAEVRAIHNPVPEPATLAALGFGAAALLRRRKS